MKLGEIIRTSLSRADTIGVKRTAVNPALWLVGLITPLALILAAIVGDGGSRWVLFAFAAAPILFMFVVYTIFMFRDPDRLQSEEYRIKLQEMKRRYRRGQSPQVIDLTYDAARIESSSRRNDTGGKE